MRVVWLLLLLAVSAAADFGQSDGFSGRRGFDCTACHVPPPVPTPEAEVALTGLPMAWDPGAAYTLHVAVTGGPVPNPVPGQPQGGFDLEADAGTFSGDTSLLRFPQSNEVTYTAAGSLLRAWDVVWTAPAEGPADTVTFWVAVVAANGNHIIGQDDTKGELGDRVAAQVVTLDPSEAALAAWAEAVVPVPVLEALPARIEVDQLPFTVRGSAAAYVERVEARIDGGPWTPLAGTDRFEGTIPKLSPGDHRLEVRAAVGDRVSDPAVHRFTVPGDRQAPGLGLAGLLAALVLARAKG